MIIGKNQLVPLMQLFCMVCNRRRVKRRLKLCRWTTMMKRCERVGVSKRASVRMFVVNALLPVFEPAILHVFVELAS